jgi:alpha-L-rhamnosidase
MNSFNHYAFGAVGDWMYRTIGGIDLDPAAPGYRRARIAPRPGGGVRSASASLETRYGRLATSWKVTRDSFRLEVTVPANTTAEVTLWDTRLDQVEEGGLPLARAVPGVRAARQQGSDVLVEVGSGPYGFTVRRSAAAP